MSRFLRLASLPAAIAALVALALPVSAAEVPEDYPLTTCVVSDEPLGSMGDAERYVHREEGKPDRVVYFCCGGCEEDFAKDPAHFLAKLDAAQSAKEGKAKQPDRPKTKEKAESQSR